MDCRLINYSFPIVLYVTWRKDEQGDGEESWGYSPVNFWLEGGLYRFGAYAPKLGITPTFDYATNEMTFSKFEATDGKTDLLVAAANKDGISGADHPMVSFAFRHALSKVRFTFIDGWRNDVKLVISNIQLINVISTGTLVTPADLQEGTSVQTKDWTIGTTTANYTDEGATLTQLNTKHLFDNFVIPQEIPEAKEGSQNLALVFTAVVSNPNGTEIAKKENITVPVSIGKGVTEWLPGNAYNYTLTISGKTFGLNPIQFDNITVEKWYETNNSQDITDGVTNIVTPKP
ncbi:MAG: fimbrillin family protein [Bacteroides sp.]|nr:fimbrillin family protein [Bacteroides sp.]